VTSLSSALVRPCLTDSEYRLMRELIQQEAGIFLAPTKKALLAGRLLPRLRDLGLTSFREYHHYVTQQDPAERARMLDCISTNETHFFREPRQFEFLEQRLIPHWKAAVAQGLRRRRIRVWSAACSSGEEPYSLAMTLLSHLPAEEGWGLEILASDISNRVLRQAQAATWPLDRAEEIPDHHLRRFMLKGTRSQAGWMRAGVELRAAVQVERINLHAASYPVAGRFDLIFCRNVLIYFDVATKERVVSQLASHLEPGGHLFLGHAESLLGRSQELENVGPTVYRSGGRPAPAAVRCAP
jgi:chemotaxis protein methyltransferase CheR